MIFLISLKEFQRTDFKNEFLIKLKKFIKLENHLNKLSKNLLFWLFDEYGLILFDPQDPQVKSLLKPVFKKEITDFRVHTEKLIQASATLEELYHAQVKVKPVNLFYQTDDGRYSVEPVENDFN